MNCRQCEDLLVDALYGELEGEAKERFEAHVQSCADCERMYADMRATLAAMDRRERRDPGQAYWDGYFNRLSARMEREQSERRSRGWRGRLLPALSPVALKWAQRGVLAALLIVFGAVVGRMVMPGRTPREVVETNAPPVETLAEPALRQASAEACARQYIEDSQVLLLALVNFDHATAGDYASDWSAERQRSRELVSQAASLKADLTDPGQRRLRNLVMELELIMLQIANLETAGDVDAVELIRSSVNDKDMMLKINLEKLRGADEAEPAPGACDV
jgi:hypothetical protein